MVHSDKKSDKSSNQNDSQSKNQNNNQSNKQHALGEVIKSGRDKMGLTRDKLAEMVSLSPRYITLIENAGKRPSFNKLYALVRTLGVNANEIFYPETHSADTSEIEQAERERLMRLLAQCSEREVKAVTALVETLLGEKE